jgi:hypothetical protein
MEQNTKPKRKCEFRCKHCGEIHYSARALSLCEKNPNREETIRKLQAHWKKCQKKGAATTNADLALRQKKSDFFYEYNRDPANRETQRKQHRLMGLHGYQKKNPELSERLRGKKQSPELIAKRLAGIKRSKMLRELENHTKIMDAALEKANIVSIASPQATNHDFFRPKIKEKTEDYWVDVTSDDPYDLF